MLRLATLRAPSRASRNFTPPLCHFSTQFSSIDDPQDHLFVPRRNPTDPSSLLRSDVRTLGTLLGQAIKSHDPDTFEKVEGLRRLTKEWRECRLGPIALDSLSAPHGPLKSAQSFVGTFSDEHLKQVSRSFAHFLRLANAAEQHNRIRSLESPGEGYNPLPDKRDSVHGAIKCLLDSGVSKESIAASLNGQTVQLILTAHPTEVNRKTLLNQTRRVQSYLGEADVLRVSGGGEYEKAIVTRGLEGSVKGLWLSDDVSRFKPTAVDEAARGTIVLQEVLWRAVPSFFRRVSDSMVHHLGSPLSLEARPVSFGSWMGGDRDGNPNVTPHVTREVMLSNRLSAARLIKEDVDGLIQELAVTEGSEELVGMLEGPVREPYREFLRPVSRKLGATVDEIEAGLHTLRGGGGDGGGTGSGSLDFNSLDPADVYVKTEDLLSEMHVLHRSLTETGLSSIADGRLTDLIRNLGAFGLALAPLDVRQESTRHTEALDCVTRYLGVGSYGDWDEATRLSWLQKQLSNKRPLIRRGVWRSSDFFTAAAGEVLETFDVVREAGPGSLAAYVISQASTASDVMAVLLLQRDAGVEEELRVVPLFETLDDLNSACGVMAELWGNAAYRGSIGNRQEIMVGYSDSAKDAGRLAASWAQYEVQASLAALAKKHGVELTFFHGKGGTVGRGGNPQTFEAILAHPPGTIEGRFRVTEQGEMITQNFGHASVAERTLDIYTAGLLSEKHTPRPGPDTDMARVMDRLGELSVEAYRKIVREDERFVPYFRSATPEPELSSLNIGSRPAKRKVGGGVESLRAIPWIFAWTQTRLNLPTWLGVGEAVSEVLDGPDGPELRRMYAEWGSFRTTIDLVEMVLAKSEPEIAKIYDDLLVSDPKARELGAEIRATHQETIAAILNLTGHESLGENNERLLRSMSVRNPYVDCLNVLQAEIMNRLREVAEDEERKKLLTDALMVSINGVAGGMKNTG